MREGKVRAGLLIPYSMARRMFPELADTLDKHSNEVVLLEAVDPNEMILTKEEIEAEMARRAAARDQEKTSDVDKDEITEE